MSEWIERCEHSDCGIDGRLEYCPEEAADYENVYVVTDMLDELLHGTQGISNERFVYSTDGEDYQVSRSLSQIELDTDIDDYDMSEKLFLSIQKESIFGEEAVGYRVQISRRYAHPQTLPTWVATHYDMNVYGADDAQLHVTEYDFASGRSEKRVMTPYDLEVLYSGLTTAYLCEHETVLSMLAQGETEGESV